MSALRGTILLNQHQDSQRWQSARFAGKLVCQGITLAIRSVVQTADGLRTFRKRPC